MFQNVAEQSAVAKPSTPQSVRKMPNRKSIQTDQPSQHMAGVVRVAVPIPVSFLSIHGEKTGKLHGFSYYLKLNISQNRDNERNLQNFCKATFSCHVKQQFDSRALYISARLILSTHLTHKSFEM